jgi:hypothetical protein
MGVRVSLFKLGTNYVVDAASGSSPGISSVNKFGRNTNVASAGTEEIWDGSAAYVFPTTAVMTKVSQTTNQAAMTGETIEVQGLDSNWDLVVQTVDLNASDTTTPVTLGTPLIRAFRMRVLSGTVIDQPIRLHNDAEDQDYAIMSAGNNQTLMAIYTVPSGKTAYITGYYAVINPGVGNPTALSISLWGVDNVRSYAKQLKHQVGLDLDFTAHIQHDFNPYYAFTERSDIYITASPTGAAADVTAGFDLILIDNDLRSYRTDTATLAVTGNVPTVTSS